MRRLSTSANWGARCWCPSPTAGTVVDIKNAQDIYLAAKHPKSFVSLDHADHWLTKSEAGLYVGHVLAAWLGAAPFTGATPGRCTSLTASHEHSARPQMLCYSYVYAQAAV
jgi:hypothetical protein